MLENDIFRFTLQLEKTSEKTSEKSSEKIIKLIHKNNQISAAEMGKIIGISSRAIEKQIAKLKEKKIIDRDGADKGGKWKVL